MKGKISRVLVSVLFLGLMLSAGLARAEVTLIPISGSQESAFHEDNDPGKVWMDEDGIRHIRGKTHYSIAQGVDDEGNVWTAEGWVTTSVNMDPATGTGNMSGHIDRYYTYRGLEGSFSGRIRATATDFVWYGEGNFTHATGDFVGWKVSGVTFSRPWPSPIATMEGFFKVPPGAEIPPGDLADKSLPAEEENTWGSLKALFR